MLTPTEFMELRVGFEDRLYRWSSEEADREVAAGFVVLRGMRNPAADTFIRAIEQWPVERQRLLLAAYRKHQQQDAARRACHLTTAADERLVAEADTIRARMAVLSLPAKRAPVAAARRAVAAALRPRLEGLLGPRTDALKNRWRFRTWVRGWRLGSVVDWGGSLYAVSYSQRLSGGAVLEGIDVGLGGLSWTGCIGLPWLNGWPAVELDSAHEVATSIAWLCGRMLEVAPELVGSDWPA